VWGTGILLALRARSLSLRLASAATFTSRISCAFASINLMQSFMACGEISIG
jgi:hypothetical protein